MAGRPIAAMPPIHPVRACDEAPMISSSFGPSFDAARKASRTRARGTWRGTQIEIRE
jgi:hypothetical protein